MKNLGAKKIQQATQPLKTLKSTRRKDPVQPLQLSFKQPFSRVSGWKLGKLVSKLVYNLCRGRIQPTYIGLK